MNICLENGQETDGQKIQKILIYLMRHHFNYTDALIKSGQLALNCFRINSVKLNQYFHVLGNEMKFVRSPIMCP